MRFLWLLFICCIAFASPALVGLSDVLPKHELQVITVTKVTPEGEKLKPVSLQSPVYYAMYDYGYMELSTPCREGALPSTEDAHIILQKVLADQGYLPASSEHPASLLLFCMWGTLNRSDGMPQTIKERDLPRKFLGVKSESEFFLTFFDRDEQKLVDASRADLFVAAIAAFDYQAAKHQEKKQFWVTRISCLALGHNLKEAYLPMVTIAGPNIGKKTDRPVWTNTAKRKGEVRLGDAKVIEHLDQDDSAASAPSTGKGQTEQKPKTAGGNP